MNPPAPGPAGGPSSLSSRSGRMVPPSMADLRRKAQARIADRVDPIRNKHKPLSLLRLEARKVAEQYFEVECPALPKAERDRLIEDTLAEAAGVSQIEELFRDPAVREVVVLGPGQVLAHKGEAWVPAGVRFRDDEQLRAVLNRFAESGEGLSGGPPMTGGADVRLPNGFRMMAILPPDATRVCPMVLFTRPAPAADAPPSGGGSSVLTVSPRREVNAPLSGRIGPRPPGSDSEVMPTRAVGEIPRSSGLSSASLSDPIARLRQKVTERIISQLAAAGVYDLAVFPQPELRKIVAAYVHEMAEWDHVGLDAPAQERITAEILAGMRR